MSDDPSAQHKHYNNTKGLVYEKSKNAPNIILRCLSLVAESFFESWILTDDLRTSWCDFLVNMWAQGLTPHPSPLTSHRAPGGSAL